MGRPPLPVGTHGSIRYIRYGNGWIARTRFRGYDGRSREFQRSGATKTAAKNNLKITLATQRNCAVDGLSNESRIKALAPLWLAEVAAQVDSGTMSPSTESAYRSNLARCVLPGVGELRICELTVARADQFLGALAQTVGVPSAKMSRTILSGMLGFAARQGIASVNPIRDTRRLTAKSKTGPRALTATERAEWVAQLEADEKAVRWDLPDLSRFMMATGVRIGEALALYWEDVDLDAALVEVRYTVVRRKGHGLVRKSPKTETSVRLLPLPSWAVQMLRVRLAVALAAGRPAGSPIFPNANGGLRDPSNTLRVLRDTRGSEGFEWVTSHTFRKTAATVLDEHGLSARLIADQLGHARPSMTQDVYLARKVAGRLAAEALEGVLGKTSE